MIVILQREKIKRIISNFLIILSKDKIQYAHLNTIRSLIIIEDLIISGSWDKTLKIWDKF